MIFVTVGTHEQPFNRLIQKVDELKRDGIIQEEVIMQTGFSTYEPQYCQWSKLIPYQQMVQMEFARNVAERMGNILVVEDIGKLEEMITDYDKITKGMRNESGSHNLEFNREFEEIVNNL